MNTPRVWLARFLGLFRKSGREQDLNDEIQFHFQQEVDHLVKQGMSAEEARLAARKRFGGMDRTKEAYRDTAGFRPLEALLQDVRYGLRALVGNPGFTAVAVVSLALGIGVNCAVFTLTNAAILRDLPVKEPQRLGRIDPSVKGRPASPSYPVFRELLQRQNSFETLAASGSFSLQHIVFRGAELQAFERIAGSVVSPDYFQMLGIQAAIGRVFTPQDSPSAGEGAVAVLRYGFWESAMGADRSVVGETITLNGVPFTIVGIAPPAFTGDQIGQIRDIWFPILMQPRFGEGDLLERRTATWFRTLGRLKPGVSGEQAASELTVLYQQIIANENQAGTGSRYRTDPADWRVSVATGRAGVNQAVGKLKAPLSLLMGVVGLVLLIACCNVANLLLARGATRQHEISTRLALGSSRARLVMQFLTESSLLALIGGALGFLLAQWSLQVFADMLPLKLDLSPDGRVFGFTLALSLVTVLLFGLFPALQSTGTRLDPVLRGARQTGGGRPRQRSSRVLVVLQVGLSLWLLIGAGLMLRSLRNLQAADLGVDRANVATFELQPEPLLKPSQFASVRAEILERMRGLPGVRAVGFSSYGVFADGMTTAPARVSGPQAKPAGDAEMRLGSVTPGFFEALGMGIVLGRDVSQADVTLDSTVGVISENAARDYFGDRSPVGEVMYFPGIDEQGRYIPFTEDFKGARRVEIIGMVRDARDRGPRQAAARIIYLPLKSADFAATLYVRSDADPDKLTPSLLGVLKEFSAHVRIENARTIDEQMAERFGFENTASRLLGFFGLLALLLAAVGLYGVMTYTVARRTPEIGVRMALGARPGRVLGMVMRETVVLVVAGIALGIPAALATTRFLESALFGLTATDATTIAAVAGILFCVAMLAGYVPARRASRVDPLVALRHE